ncbi:hypothetical protein [Arthrobacter sp. zg-Y1110]|uniref:hypothetical protein n=1 Tax=Arthrobacter sp. zg-Y1110 TaxID=2886932 RepID=UPI001D146675|nr:hypothetical protein [Arthrobacter sp. zg-Y1110]MCC3292997.1 hypothetical protein [Arthrobacter sp. zg-Y1110]UWX86936.1 hypothetical protein N2K99_19010 [Arthrobacter sp. zg-Y1110]
MAAAKQTEIQKRTTKAVDTFKSNKPLKVMRAMLGLGRLDPADVTQELLVQCNALLEGVDYEAFIRETDIPKEWDAAAVLEATLRRDTTGLTDAFKVEGVFNLNSMLIVLASELKEYRAKL